MLRPEDRLLLACSRADVGDTQVATTFDALGEGVDWRYVVEASIRHAVAPLMSNGLDLVERADPRLRDVVPPDVRQELDELRRGTARRSARLFGIVGEIADQFEPRDIALLALKDLQLAIEVYPDPSLRPMGDVDLLIRREDWSSAASALAELDFAPVPDRHQPFTDRYAGGRQFRRAADETWIDLQWHIAEREWDREGIGRFTFDTGRVWDRSQPLAVAGRKILAPSPEDMLIHLCLHLEGHEYSELVLFSDIVTFLARGASQLDWDGLVAVAHASGGASGVHQVLAVTERLFGSAPPDGVIEALRPTYFRGSLNTPLFGNSTTLHLALDDIAAAHDPPQELLTEVERLVREQVTTAMTVEALLDDVATAATANGAQLVVFDGTPSPRHFPDATLPPFAPVEIFVLHDDMAFVEGRLTSALESTSHLRYRVTWVTQRGLAAALAAAPDGNMSNRRAALSSLRARTSRRRADDTVELVLRPVTAEELVVCLAVRVGRRLDGQLFAMATLVRALDDVAVDPQVVARLASDHGVAADAARGIAFADAQVGSNVTSTLRASLPHEPTPWLLTWARYGPSALERRPELRELYFTAFVLLSPGPARERVRYAWRARPVVWQAAKAMLERWRHPPPAPDARTFAYWIEPSDGA